MSKNKINIISENDNSTVVTQYTPINKTDNSYQSEAQLEKEFIDTLVSQGYEYLPIKDNKQLEDNLRVQMQKLNNYIFSDDEWKRFHRDILAKKTDSIIEKTKKIQDERKFDLLLDNGTKKNIDIIDEKHICNNSLQVINQYSTEGGTYINRYDVTILVNGLPLVHIELKRRGVRIEEACNQIKRYQRDSFWADSGMFEWIQIFVISNGTDTKYFSNTIRESTLKAVAKPNTFEFTSYWADSQNHNIQDLIDFTKTFFAKRTILNVLIKYCVFTSDEKLLVMRPYQIVATEKIVNRIVCGHKYKKYGSVDGGGYIWHTTGSGKTLTSFKTAILISKLEDIKKVMFVVDRKDLDYQTMKEYDKFQKDSTNSNTSTKILAEQLNNPNKKIIITTIQKLSNFIKQNKSHAIYNDEIVLVFDECHRSHFGEMHKAIKNKFNKYYMFGFTGTPIFAENAGNNYQTTESLFGEKLHTYTIMDAINDKNVLRFLVSYNNTVQSKNDVSDKKVENIDKNNALNNEKRISAIVNYILEHYKQKTWSEESYIFNAVNNITQLAKNIKAHEDKKERNIKGFNSLLACASIEAARKYYEAFKKAQHNLKVAIIYSYGVNDDSDGLEEENSESTENLNKPDREFLYDAIKDYNKYFGTNYDTSSEKFQNYYRDCSMRMKNKEIDILIVVNMFLTGFDATTLNTLWVDKNLRYHGLLQAFSRTNRILNKSKSHGNIVCFRNLEDDLNKALKLFGNKDAKSIVLLKTYSEYINGYNDGKTEFVGYKELVNQLKGCYTFGTGIIYGESEKKEFVKLFGQILKVRNILTSFDEFSNNTLLKERELQDYQSHYLQLYDEFRKPRENERENINDDLVFEIELIKQIEVNIDYILNLLDKNNNENTDKDHSIEINKIIDSSIELRSKKILINEFIQEINGRKVDVYQEWLNFVKRKRKNEFDAMVDELKLDRSATNKTMKKAFASGELNLQGDIFSKILPKLSVFNGGDYSKTKLNVKRILIDYFEKYVDISDKDFD